jgi:hypothetical protein
MPDDKLTPPPGITCVRCLTHGHHAKAVEYVEKLDGNGLEALCLFCRDGDPCEGCERHDKENMEELKRLARTAPTVTLQSKPLVSMKVVDVAHVKEKAVDKQCPLEKVGVSIPEALKMFKSGTSIEDLAKHYKIPVWRFWQSAKWNAAKKGIGQPAPERKERKPYTRKSNGDAKVAGGGFRHTLLAVKADFLMRKEELDKALASVDYLLARYPE